MSEEKPLGMQILYSKPWITVIKLPDRSIVKVQLPHMPEYPNTFGRIIISRGSCRHRETITIAGEEIFITKGSAKNRRKFHIGDLFRINRGLRRFRRGDTKALLAAARTVLDMPAALKEVNKQ